MSIKMDCPACGQRYVLQAALAGKKARCKKCGETFKIPSLEPSSALAPLPAEDLYGFDEEPVAKGSASSASTLEDTWQEEEALPPARGRGKTPGRSGTKRKERGLAASLAESFSQFSTLIKIVAIGSLVLLVLTVISAFILPGKAPLFAMPLMLLGVGMAIGGSIGLLIAVFREGLVHGILALVVPLYAIIFGLTRSETRPPLAVFAMGLTLTLGLAFGMKALNERVDKDMEAFLATPAPFEIADNLPDGGDFADISPELAENNRLGSGSGSGSGSETTKRPVNVVESLPESQEVIDHRQIMHRRLELAMEAAPLLIGLRNDALIKGQQERLADMADRMSEALERSKALPPLAGVEAESLRTDFAFPFQMQLPRLEAGFANLSASSAADPQTTNAIGTFLKDTAGILGLPFHNRPASGPGFGPGRGPGFGGSGPSGPPLGSGGPGFPQ